MKKNTNVHIFKQKSEAKIDAAKLFFGWFEDKKKSILKFREENYASVHTGFKGKTTQKWVSS